MSVSRYYFDEISATDQQQIITDALNQPPFNRKLSLVGLSEALQNSAATVQLLCDVVYHIRPSFEGVGSNNTNGQTTSDITRNPLLYSNEKTINGPTCAIVNTQNIDTICSNLTQIILPFFLHVMVLNFQHSAEKKSGQGIIGSNLTKNGTGGAGGKNQDPMEAILSDYAIGSSQLVSNINGTSGANNSGSNTTTENGVANSSEGAIQEGNLTKPTDAYNIISCLFDHSETPGELVPPPTAMAGTQQPASSRLITVGNNIRMHQESSTIIITPTDISTFSAALKSRDACRVLLVMLRQPPNVTRDLIYLAHFKFDYSVPAEYALEPEIQALRTETRSVMTQVLESELQVHNANYEELGRLYTKLTSESRTILERCTKLRANLEKLRANIDPQVLDLVVRARHAKDTENDLKRQAKQQYEQQKALVSRNSQLKDSLNNTTHAFYDKCIAENASLHKELEVDIPKKLMTVKQRMQILSVCSSDPMACKEIAKKMIQAYTKLAQEEENLQAEVAVFDTGSSGKDGDQEIREDQTDSPSAIIEEIEKVKKNMKELQTRAEAVKNRYEQALQKEALFEKELVKTSGLIERGIISEVDMNTNNAAANNNLAGSFSYVMKLDMQKLAENGNKLPVIIWEDILLKGKRLKPVVIEAMDQIKHLKNKYAILQRTKDVLSAIVAKESSEAAANGRSGIDTNQNNNNTQNQSADQLQNETRSSDSVTPMPQFFNANNNNSSSSGVIVSDLNNTNMDSSPVDTQLGGVSTNDPNELTALISFVESELKTHQTALAPRIKELAVQRELANKLNEQLLVTKEKVNNLEASSQGSLFKLKAAATKLMQEVNDIESEKITVEHVNQCLKAELDRAKNEKEVANLKRQLVAETNNERVLSEQLKQKQALVSNKIPHMLKQKGQFTSLFNILKAVESSSMDKKKAKFFTSGGVNKLQTELGAGVSSTGSSNNNTMANNVGYTTTYSGSTNINTNQNDKQINSISSAQINENNKMFAQNQQPHNMFDITE